MALACGDGILLPCVDDLHGPPRLAGKKGADEIAGAISLRPPKAPPMVIFRTRTLFSGIPRALDSGFAFMCGPAFGIQISRLSSMSKRATTAYGSAWKYESSAAVNVSSRT